MLLTGDILRQSVSQNYWLFKKPRRIRSIVEYVALIKEVYEAQGDRQFYYRGHGNKTWTIQPYLARADVHKHLKTTYATADLITIQTLLVERLRRLSEHHAASVHMVGPPLDYISWLTVAQHHGLPTFLLDFSLNPLVGLYFACKDAYDSSAEAKSKLKSGCVWIMDCVPKSERQGSYLGTILHLEAMEMDSALDPAARVERNFEKATRNVIVSTGDIAHPVLIVPRLTTRRLESQAGRFIYFPKSEIALESYDQHFAVKPWKLLKKLCYIPKDCKEDILNELLRFRIHQGTMDADIDGYSKFLKWGKL